MTTLSLASILAESARRRPEHLALVEGDRRVAYGSLWAEARSCAADLARRGVAPGTRVALMAPNVIEFVRAYYGIVAAGGVVVPVPTLLQDGEVAYILRHSGAALLVHHATYATVATAAADQVGVPTIDAGELGADVEPMPSFVTRQADDPVVIFYTSGTTGRPKGAVLTHLNLVLNATVNVLDANPFAPDDVVLGCLPFFHIFGQSVSLNSTFRVGATLVLQPRFDAPTALDLMVREGVGFFLGVPTMYVQLIAAAEGRQELPRLHTAISGGAALPVVVLERFEERFGSPIYEGYGLSETSPTASVNQAAFGARAGTVGHAIWGVDVEVADESVQDRIVLLGPGQRGEVVIRGHNVFAGYLDDPGATAQVVVDGWFRTGDIGIRDEDGYLSIVDRTKDLIIRGGFNVYPREVEEVLARHDAVSQVAVIGVPDAERGEEVCAVVVLEPGRDVPQDELVAWAKERLGRHKYPRRVEVVDVLPIGPSHKVLKRELRERFGSAGH